MVQPSNTLNETVRQQPCDGVLRIIGGATPCRCLRVDWDDDIDLFYGVAVRRACGSATWRTGSHQAISLVLLPIQSLPFVAIPCHPLLL